MTTFPMSPAKRDRSAPKLLCEQGARFSRVPACGGGPFPWRVALSALVVLVPVVACAQTPQPTTWDAFQTQRSAWLSELAASAWHCVQQPDTTHIIFSGCYDWHSAVHGHWALLRVARLTGDKQHLDWLKASLNAQDVAKEQAYMRENPTFELPYGRAWFLLLAIEHHAVTQTDTLSAMAIDIAQSLRDFYTKTPPNPLSEEYDNASWALTCLSHYYQYTKNKEGSQWVQGVVKQHLTAPNPDINPAKDLRAWPEFFSRWGNWALALSTVQGAQAVQAWLQSQPAYPPEDFVVVSSPSNAHHLSMNFSRAWGFWALYEATNDLRYRDLYLSHVAAGMHDHPSLKDDYGRYGHWVSQFGIFALSISALGVDQDPSTPIPQSK